MSIVGLGDTFSYNDGSPTRKNAVLVAVANPDGTAIGTVAADGTITKIASSSQNVTLLARNAQRKGAVINNTASTMLYVACTAAPAAAEAFTYCLPPRSSTDLPFGYTGPVNGLWADNPGDGWAVITEFA